MVFVAVVCVIQMPPAFSHLRRYFSQSSIRMSPGRACRHFSLDLQVLTSVSPNQRRAQSILLSDASATLRGTPVSTIGLRGAINDQSVLKSGMGGRFR